MNNTQDELTYQLCYDNDCPMCVGYTGYFQQHGYLKVGEALPFHECSTQILQQIDPQKMTRQIPLVDLRTNQIRYGLSALLHIIAKKHPGLARFGGQGFAKKCLGQCYNFISYNRKVIVGKMPALPGLSFDPPFHAGYRWLFVAVTTIFASLFWWPAVLWSGQMPMGISVALMQTIILGSSFIFQLRHLHFNRHSLLEWAGQLTMLLLLNSFGFFLFAIAFQFSGVQLIGLAVWMVWQAGCMLPQWYRRVEYLRYRATVKA